MSTKALKFRSAPPVPPLREMSNMQLINAIAQSVTWAIGNLDETAVALLKVMEIEKKYGVELPEFRAISGACRLLVEARRTIDMLRYRIEHGK